MGSRERRTREREETRDRILDAARKMFVRHGYEATTMRAIADKIEYTPTAIYHHFRNKQALLTELATSDLQSLAAAFRQIGRIEDPVERLGRIGQAYVEFALEHPMHYQLIFMTQHPLETVKMRLARQDPSEGAYGFLRSACAEAIQSGRLRPVFKDPDELAQMLWSSVHGLMALHIVKGKDQWINWRDPRKTTARMNEAIMRGLLRDSEG
jgi:AcrR family transcriptional regulator